MNHTMRTGNKSISADVLIEKFKRPESVALRAVPWKLCYGKVLDTRGSTCFSIIITGTPSKQRQEVNAPRTRRGLCAELLKEERFRCR